MSEVTRAALLPCPFCGSADINSDHYGHSQGYRYNRLCNDCGTEGPFVDGETWEGALADATEAWNRRAALAAAPESGLSEQTRLQAGLRAIQTDCEHLTNEERRTISDAIEALEPRAGSAEREAAQRLLDRPLGYPRAGEDAQTLARAALSTAPPSEDAETLARMWLNMHYADGCSHDEMEAACWRVLGEDSSAAPFVCIKPQCPPDCDQCNHAVPGWDTARILVADLLSAFAVDGHGGALEDGESVLVDRARRYLARGESPPAPATSSAGPDSSVHPDVRVAPSSVGPEIGRMFEHVTPDGCPFLTLVLSCDNDVWRTAAFQYVEGVGYCGAFDRPFLTDDFKRMGLRYLGDLPRARAAMKGEQP